MAGADEEKVTFYVKRRMGFFFLLGVKVIGGWLNIVRAISRSY